MTISGEARAQDAAFLLARAVRWVSDDPFPGMVRVQFYDADGARVVIEDKAPVIDGERCTAGARYPLEVALSCRILAATPLAYDIELGSSIEDLHGRNRFTIRHQDVVLRRYGEAECED